MPASAGIAFCARTGPLAEPMAAAASEPDNRNHVASGSSKILRLIDPGAAIITIPGLGRDCGWKGTRCRGPRRQASSARGCNFRDDLG